MQRQSLGNDETLLQPGNILFDRLFIQRHMENLASDYRQLINVVLPQTFTYPVRFNHCFARIVLDWLFEDCWYNHLRNSGPAYKQLNEAQLRLAIGRMRQWLQDPQLLVQDNNNSLSHRRTLRNKGQ